MFNQADLSIQIYKKVQVYILSLKKYFAADCAQENDLHLPSRFGFRMNFIGSGSIRSKYLNMTKRIQSRSVTGTHELRVLSNQERELLQIFWKHRTATGRSQWSHRAVRFVTLAGEETVMIALIIITIINHYPNHHQSKSKLLSAKWWRKIGQIPLEVI